MHKSSSSRSEADVQESQEFAAAREEIAVLDILSDGLSATISNLLRQRPRFEKRDSGVEFAINEARYSSLEAHRELAQHSYGRTVVGQEIDEDGNPQRSFTYRITQANVGFIDGGCNVLARNSPIASRLVTVDAGEEAEVKVPKGTRYLVAKQVRVFNGPTSLFSSGQRPSFRSMVLSSAALGTDVIVQNLREYVQSYENRDRVLDRAEVAEKTKTINDDPTWIEDWGGIFLSDSENSSLSAQFFTRTTKKQEHALNNPRGLTFVEGIAGSGKTSVALGRLKFFANFESGEHLDEYGLRGAGTKDFSPTNMVGFVLSHSLRRYLKEAATELNMPQLPVLDFQEFRADLSNRYGLTKIFKRDRAEAPRCRTQLSWLLAIDAALAQIAAKRLRDAIDGAADIPSPVKGAVNRVADDLEGAQPSESRSRFHLAGLASRISDVAMEAEFRTREIAIREKMAREELRNQRVDLQDELDRVLQEEERRTLSPLARKLLAAIYVQDMIELVPELAGFDLLVRRAFGDRAPEAELDHSIRSFFSTVRNDEGKKSRAASDSDLTALIVVSAMFADGFDRPDAPGHFYQVRRRNAVFIDEVQDFTETEIFLMGMTVTDTYGQITLSGDRRQRLQERGTEDYRDLFPFISRARTNPSIFLDRNFRQREEMAVLSAGYRAILQEELSTVVPAAAIPIAYLFDERRDMADFVLHRLSSIDPYATTALILPSEEEARRWYDILRDDLATYHRPALLSRRDDLTRRNEIHITDVRETKGLEFDVVIVPDVSSFVLADPIGRNRLYVAISRPRHALLIGLPREAQADQHVKKLLDAGLLRLKELPDLP